MAPKQEPITIADQGFFWVGVQRKKMPYGTITAGQMYVQYQIPAKQTHPYPLVLVHGGGGQGLDYLGTPDGREGWATWFLRQGYAVYVVDRPGHGRAPYHADALGPASPPATYEGLGDLFTRPAEKMPSAYPQAKLHNQWPKRDAGADRSDPRPDARRHGPDADRPPGLSGQHGSRRRRTARPHRPGSTHDAFDGRTFGLDDGRCAAEAGEGA